MWDSVQQLVRIVLQLVAGYLVGAGIMTDEIMQAFVGGGVSLAAVAWWVFWERHRADPRIPDV